MIPEIEIVMQDQTLRKAFGARIKTLRKQRKWTQKELAAKIDTPVSMLNKYESGLHAPAIEKLVELAELFDVTVDFLLTGNRSEDKPLHNLRLLERFQELEGFSTEDQEAVITLIDALVVRNRVAGAVQPFPKKTG
jgi:transcriptional regulator with XRE-family HTH domain